MDCKCYNCSPPTVVTIVASLCGGLTFLFVTLSIVAAVILRRCKAKPHPAARERISSPTPARKCKYCCSCWCVRDKNKSPTQEQQEEIELPELDHSDTATTSDTADSSISKRMHTKALSIAVTWVRSIKARLLGVKAAKTNTLPVAEALETHICDNTERPRQDPLQQNNCTEDHNTSEDRSKVDTGDSAVVVAPSITIHSHQHHHPRQHEELVTGKSSFIGDRYPKLALSEDPPASSHNTDDSQVGCGVGRQDSEALACDSQDVREECDSAVSSLTQQSLVSVGSEQAREEEEREEARVRPINSTNWYDLVEKQNKTLKKSKGNKFSKGKKQRSGRQKNKTSSRHSREEYINLLNNSEPVSNQEQDIFSSIDSGVYASNIL